jgi:UDP-N-acetylmuramoyl-L-alanyl-D-glutamate--2,6-diaminopimelate ligase
VKLSELAGEMISNDADIAGITADSRAVERGYLFAALPGEISDGAQFIPQAEERGAAAVLARPGATSRLPIVIDQEPRRRLSHMAARFFPRQPKSIAGITGTNGKTSTACFASELWSLLGNSSGSLGTLGAIGENYHQKLVHTTPEPVTLHHVLDDMAAAGISHLAMEVSSHGLAQFRADGVRFSIAAFTNITQDHLDYHGGFKEYFNAKLRLFTDLLPEGGAVVVNADGEGADDIIEAAQKRSLRIITTGAGGDDLKLISALPKPSGLDLKIEAGGELYELCLPLIGGFQAENALLAAGIVMASGAPCEKVLPLLEKLSGVPGRMQHAAEIVFDSGSASIYVDYAHTPDAVATALQAIRPHAQGRVIAIIGAGGDRDKTKRFLMGKAAAAYADAVIVTDDNPRTEDPAQIRQYVLEGCPGATEIGDRRQAIAAGVAMLGAGDVLLITGKGHETGQQVGAKILPFNDMEAAKASVLERIKELGR